MFVVYSKDGCTYCKKAKDLLEFLGETFEEFNCSDDPNYKLEMIERLQEEPIEPPYTFPQIWTENEYIGGYTELNKLLE